MQLTSLLSYFLNEKLSWIFHQVDLDCFIQKLIPTFFGALVEGSIVPGILNYQIRKLGFYEIWSKNKITHAEFYQINFHKITIFVEFKTAAKFLTSF